MIHRRAFARCFKAFRRAPNLRTTPHAQGSSAGVPYAPFSTPQPRSTSTLVSLLNLAPGRFRRRLGGLDSVFVFSAQPVAIQFTEELTKLTTYTREQNDAWAVQAQYRTFSEREALARLNPTRSAQH